MVPLPHTLPTHKRAPVVAVDYRLKHCNRQTLSKEEHIGKPKIKMANKNNNTREI